MSRHGGFTLVEVLVALVIVALGMAALMETMGSSADTVSWLRDRSFAQWIGFNQLTLLRLSGEIPDAGNTDGELDFAGRHWRWRQEVTPLGFPGVVRVDVKVQPADTPLDEKHWMATVTGGLGDAVAPAQLQSLYGDPGQAYGSGPQSSAPSSAPGSSSAPQSGPQTPLIDNPSPAPASAPQGGAQ